MAGKRKPAASSTPEVVVNFDFNYETKRMVRFDNEDESSDFRSFYIPQDAAETLGLAEGQGIVVTITPA